MPAKMSGEPRQPTTAADRLREALDAWCQTIAFRHGPIDQVDQRLYDAWLAALTATPAPESLDFVWIVVRKSDGEAMAVYASGADAAEDVAMRNRHRDRYKVEGWQVLGTARAAATEDADAE